MYHSGTNLKTVLPMTGCNPSSPAYIWSPYQQEIHIIEYHRCINNMLLVFLLRRFMDVVFDWALQTINRELRGIGESRCQFLIRVTHSFTRETMILSECASSQTYNKHTYLYNFTVISIDTKWQQFRIQTQAWGIPILLVGQYAICRRRNRVLHTIYNPAILFDQRCKLNFMRHPCT